MNKDDKRAILAKAQDELAHDMRMLALAYPDSVIPANLRDAAEEKFLRVADKLGIKRPASYK